MALSSSIPRALENFLARALFLAFPECPEGTSVEVTQASQEAFGHYQSSTPMKLAKVLRESPEKLAEKWVAASQGVPERSMVERLEVARPGFINIRVTNDFLKTRLQHLLEAPRLGIETPKRQRVIVEFSSPNTAKELHVGHLRSTIIGEALARTFEFLGHDVLRLNHIGDWGTAFGMLIAYLKQGRLANLERMTLSELVVCYKDAKQRFDEDPDFKKQSQREVVSLQGGDKEALRIWEIICEVSRRAYNAIYALLDVSIVERGESFYNPLLPEIVRDLEKKGLIAVSDGAKCVFLEGFQNREGAPLPLMVQKSDGGYNYDTTDMAAIYHRAQIEKADRIIYVTDNGQATHFQMIFAAAKKAGYVDPARVRLDHVPFGLVLGSDGKKFRTRAGETERLIDLISGAIAKARDIIGERHPEWSADEVERVAKILGIGAIKYADLACSRTSDYSFSYDRMLRFEGNTAAFILYSYVRCESIKRKVGVDIATCRTASIALTHASEVKLGLCLAQFQEAVDQVAEDLLPNRLTDYLYRLAETFNAFFRDCRVEGSEEQEGRLLLVEATARTLKTGLHLLGIATVDYM